ADAILPAGRRIGDLIIAEHAIASEVLNAKLSLRGAAAAEINLFLAEHAGLSIIGCLRRYVETFSENPGAGPSDSSALMGSHSEGQETTLRPLRFSCSFKSR